MMDILDDDDQTPTFSKHKWLERVSQSITLAVKNITSKSRRGRVQDMSLESEAE
jgi:hypothetical protein